MCLILLKPKEVQLPKMLFKNVYERNKDGFGYMLLDETDTPKFEKILPKRWEEAWELFEPHADKHVGLHWRFKTHGKIDQENAHPYVVRENEILMMHNGTIQGTYNVDKSDTWMFIDDVLSPVLDMLGDGASEALKSAAFRRLIGSYVGGGSRLLFLTRDGFTGVNDFIKADDSYVPQLQGIFFSNVYAWDNQYWFKHASENEFNKGMVLPWRSRYTSSAPYSITPTTRQGEKDGKETQTSEASTTVSESGEEPAPTRTEQAKHKSEADNGKHRGHENPHKDLVKPLKSTTLHLKKTKRQVADELLAEAARREDNKKAAIEQGG